MIGLDTNVLVRYVMQDDPRQSPKATRLIESLTSDQPGFVPLVAIVELVWVLSSSYGLNRDQIAEALNLLLRSKELVIDRAERVLQARSHPQQGYRTALGILRLAKAYGNGRLEAACQRAARLRAISYRSLASILKHGLDRQTATPAQASLPLHHANVRGPAYYH